ncbi:1-acylglycerol-3-phosphate O-acyltransferase [Hahella sp. SMD15-11]|uniref:1-acyl-sn-glycerol-3-phosphate acyltransferase n=1 Tax=Thermohahella caldifontis TaxID=3142973 RepID=A0AB39UZ68_9GAMM
MSGWFSVSSGLSIVTTATTVPSGWPGGAQDHGGKSHPHQCPLSGHHHAIRDGCQSSAQFRPVYRGGIVPKGAVSVGKSVLKWVPLFGQMYWLAGNVLINRSRRNQAVATMNATAEAMQRERKSIWIFPEGTRNRGNNMLPFKKGAFHLAVSTGAPIIPVCVSSYLDVLKPGSGRAKEVLIEVLAPIPTVGMTAKDVPRLMEMCRNRMLEAYARLEAQLNGDSEVRLAA